MPKRREQLSSAASGKRSRPPPPLFKNLKLFLKLGWLTQTTTTPWRVYVMVMLLITSVFYISATFLHLASRNSSLSKPLKIGIVSSAYLNEKGEPHLSNVHEFTLSSYSAGHGYTWLHIQQQLNISDLDPQLHHRVPHWHKWFYINRYLELFDWLLFLDSDTYIMDQSRKIEEYIKLAGPTIDLIVSDYGARVNIGAILIRNSPWSKEFLNLWWEQGENFYGNDNGGFNHALMLAGLPQIYKGECSKSTMANQNKDMIWYDDCFNGILDRAGYPYCSRKLDRIWMIGTCPEEVIRPLHLWSNPHSPTYHPLACFRRGDFILHTRKPYEFFDTWNVSYPKVNDFYLRHIGIDVFDSKTIKRDSCW